MAITLVNYGSVADATTYFANRLHEHAWTEAEIADRPKALLAATAIIDTLNFKGNKHPVHELLENNASATVAEVRAAEASQLLEFPRGSDTTVPQAIERACYEIAHALLDDIDPELELEALQISSAGYESVRTTYSRSQEPVVHIINGVPSSLAWRLLQPFLRDEDAIRLARIS